jgi:hypothetical protein
MKTLPKFTILLLSIWMFFIETTPVSAVPPLPSSFYGTVRSNGANVPAGTQVTALINGVLYAMSPYLLYNNETVYSLNVPGDDPQTQGIIEGGKSGDTVVFFVAGIQTDQTGLWQSGTNINLDLTVSLPDFENTYFPLIFQ